MFNTLLFRCFYGFVCWIDVKKIVSCSFVVVCLQMFIFNRWQNKVICFLRIGKVNYFIKDKHFVDRLFEE